MSVRFNAIAAINKYNRGLAKNGKLPWGVISEDVRYFNDKVSGHVVIMGRKTYDTIKNEKYFTEKLKIVVTRKPQEDTKYFAFVKDIYAAKKLAEQTEASGEVFIVGGGEIYKQMLPYTDRLYLTVIDGNYPNPDTVFPEYESKFTKKVSDSGTRKSSSVEYSFVVLKK
jgi:dihydrofolate reductase